MNSMSNMIVGAIIVVVLFASDILNTQPSKLYDKHGKPVSCKVISFGDFPFHFFCETKKTAHLR